MTTVIYVLAAIGALFVVSMGLMCAWVLAIELYRKSARVADTTGRTTTER